MSCTAPDVTARAIIDVITYDAIIEHANSVTSLPVHDD